MTFGTTLVIVQLKMLRAESQSLSKIWLVHFLVRYDWGPRSPWSPRRPSTHARPVIFQVTTHTQELSNNTSSHYEPYPLYVSQNSEIILSQVAGRYMKRGHPHLWGLETSNCCCWLGVRRSVWEAQISERKWNRTWVASPAVTWPSSFGGTITHP